MRRSLFLVVGVLALLAAATAPRALADTSIADLSSATPVPTAEPTAVVTVTATPVATAAPSSLAQTGFDLTLPLALSSAGIMGLSLMQLRKKS